MEHDQKIRVGHQRHDTVQANSYSEFKAEEHPHHPRRAQGGGPSQRPPHRSQRPAPEDRQQAVRRGRPGDPPEQRSEGGAGGRRRTDPQGRRQLPQARRQRRDPLRGQRPGQLRRPGPDGSDGAAPLLPGPPLDADAATAGQVLDNPAHSRPERKGPGTIDRRCLGDPAQGSQVVLLPPESEA
ncbi:hypothetical protein ACPA9J_19465 [Pseudomonas aeruginosa]